MKENRKEAYYCPELFAAEVQRKMEEKRSKLNVEKLTRRQVEAIVKDIFKNGMERPEVKDE